MIKKTKKLLFVISSDIFVRNYVNTKVVNDLSKTFDISIIIGNKVSLPIELNDNIFIERVHYAQKTLNKHNRVFNAYLWQFRNKSKTFNYRIRRKKNRLKLLIVNINIKDIKKILVLTYDIFINTVMMIRPIFNLYEKYVVNKLPINNDLLNLVVKINPDIIAMPSSAHEAIGNDIVRIGKQKAIKTIFLIDNWDNLSSKSILFYKPDFLTVWGNQTRSHAIEIQGFNKDQIRPIGTPRYDLYFHEDALNFQYEKVIKNDYILFLGTFLEFDEFKALSYLDNIISKNKDLFRGTVIMYRPHPWRLKNENIDISSFINVELDPQAKNYINKNNFQPSLEYYPGLLKYSKFVVGGLTSMMIESLIMKKKYVVLAYPEKDNVTNQYEVLLNYEHFNEVEQLKNLTLCYELEELSDIALELISKTPEMIYDGPDPVLDNIIYSDNLSYSSRLLNVLNEIS